MINKGNSAPEIRRRLTMAREAVSKMDNIWRSRRVSLNLKLRVLRATAFPIVIYGSESWTMQKADERRVDAFEMWCYRRVLRIPWTERKTNAWVMWVLDKIENRLMLREMVRKRKLRFFGHVIRRKGLERTVITGKVNGKRKRGRPPTSWLKDIKSSTVMTRQDVVRAAEDRERWRWIVKTTASHNATSD